MGIITDSQLLTTEEELIWVDYIGYIAKQTFNTFKNSIVKNNTQIKLIVDPMDYSPNIMGHYSDQAIKVSTHNILRTAIGYGLGRLKIMVNTITINAIIHELFHADQYIESRIEIPDASVIEDAVYSITFDFISRNYQYICDTISPIDLGDLQAQYHGRNLALYGQLESPKDMRSYERITPQLMIDNILRFITSEDIFNRYKMLSPLTKPSIGININGTEYMKDIIWVKYNNQYNIVNIQYLQRQCSKYMQVGSAIHFRESLYENANSIIFVFELKDQTITPIKFKEV